MSSQLLLVCNPHSPPFCCLLACDQTPAVAFSVQYAGSKDDFLQEHDCHFF